MACPVEPAYVPRTALAFADQCGAAGRPWFPLAIQHVVVMYAGAAAVPLVVTGADTAFLLSADLFSSDG